MVKSAHNSAPEWQSCRFYTSLRNVTLLNDLQSKAVSNDQPLVYGQTLQWNRSMTSPLSGFIVQTFKWMDY